MKVTDYIARFLSDQGVDHVFEVVGGMTTHLIDSIYQQGKIRLISTHHEQAAAFAADGWARMKGVPGVALATSGPGAINLLTGIADCYFDSTPAVFITGQVNRNEQKGNRSIRQLGFQETDIVSMAIPVTKAAWRVQAPEEIPHLLYKSFELALSGRPGPVLIDIPMDVQRTEIPDELISSISQGTISSAESQLISEDQIKPLFNDLKTAQRPLILVGGGIRSSRTTDLFRQLIEQIKIPIVHSLMGVDLLPYAHSLRVGMIGTYGNRWANMAVGRSDFLLVLGSRLDIRQTGSDTESFKRNRIIYHVDCEFGEINNRVKGCHSILANLNSFLIVAMKMSRKEAFSEKRNWMSEINVLKNKWPDTDELRDISGINPNKLMHQLSRFSNQASAYVVDVGQHQMWAAQSLELGSEQRFMTSGGLGSMGFALPASIGASLVTPGRPAVMIAGDGAFQLNIQELQTVARNCLPIKMVIINNQCYGMVRQFQQSYFNERYQSTYWGYTAPDFTQVAQAYGIASYKIGNANEIDRALKWMWKDPLEPSLLEVMINPKANAYPKIAFGLPMTEMEPFVKPADMEST